MCYAIITILVVVVMYQYQKNKEYKSEWLPVWHGTGTWERWSGINGRFITENVSVSIVRNTKTLQLRIVTTGDRPQFSKEYKAAVEAMRQLSTSSY